MNKKDIYTKDYQYWISVMNDEDKLIEMFNKEITKHFDSKEQERLIKCLEYIKNKHQGQSKRNGVPYYTHPLMVSLFAMSYIDIDSMEAILSALLHDVLEDTPTTYAEIERIYGKDVAHLVDLLSKEVEGLKKDKFNDYYKHIQSNNKALLLKACDRLTNLHQLHDEAVDSKFRIRYIKKTYDEIIPITKEIGELHERMLNALSILEDEQNS